MIGTLVLAMPGSGKTTAVKRLNQKGIPAWDADFGDFRKEKLNGKHYNEVTYAENAWLRKEFSKILKQYLSSGALVMTNEPSFGTLMADMMPVHILYVLPFDINSITKAVAARDMRTQGKLGWFGKDYLKNGAIWLSDWERAALSTRRHANVSVVYGQLPWDLERIVTRQYIANKNYEAVRKT